MDSKTRQHTPWVDVIVLGRSAQAGKALLLQPWQGRRILHCRGSDSMFRLDSNNLPDRAF
jgi:hypothetical protein